MKNKALTAGLLIGLTVLGALTYRMDSYRVVYPERIGYERFHRYNIFSIPFFQKKTHESFPYDQEFEAIYERTTDSVSPLKRRADYTKKLLSSINKCYDEWTHRERKEILEAIYLHYRNSAQLSEAKTQLKALNIILPADIEEMRKNTFQELDELRDSVDLKRNLGNTIPKKNQNDLNILF